MSLIKRNREVFIVRIWREAREGEGRVPQWRGVVESVQNGEWRCVEDLEEVMTFINLCLESMSFNVKRRWPVQRRQSASHKTNHSQCIKTERRDT
jgi:hypothetical protein